MTDWLALRVALPCEVYVPWPIEQRVPGRVLAVEMVGGHQRRALVLYRVERSHVRPAPFSVLGEVELRDVEFELSALGEAIG